MGAMMVVAWLLQIVSSRGSDDSGGDGDDGGVESFDCVVCLCEVSPADHHRKLPNCNHGVQFHEGCIDSWLKNHSTCPMCRIYVPQTVHRRLYLWFSLLWHDIVDYCDSALENVAASIGDCREF
ncbi:hypothetical protein L6452_18286 [Arctium lappa]|uniref:Uncharacterized protein n=1 Tax=Arctium lappa TaxID=4217 RepID=A0ACB9C5X3_ARCLA|nr:hypothetical protein L6452_18286 [Arctium lappa]